MAKIIIKVASLEITEEAIQEIVCAINDARSSDGVYSAVVCKCGNVSAKETLGSKCLCCGRVLTKDRFVKDYTIQ